MSDDPTVPREIPPATSAPADLAGAPSRPIAPPTYNVPNDCLTKATWSPTNRREGTASGGRWVEDDENDREALMKPGDPQPNRLDAIREYIPYVMGKWLGVATKLVELQERDSCPVAMCVEIGKTILTYAAVRDPVGRSINARAFAVFKDIVGVVVLDVLVGAQDRGEKHLVYSEDRAEWISIDYSHSFGVDGVTGIGDFNAPFTQNYFDEYYRAVADNQALLGHAIKLADGIPDEAFAKLVRTPSRLFASDVEKDAMIRYLCERRKNVRQTVDNWCKLRGIARGE